jgi:epoxyqueuosine reductase
VSIPRQERAALLKGWALEAGFDRAGVAELAPAQHAEALRSWLARGDQASMAWMERRVETRLDARTLFPAARSALVVALQYHPAQAGDEPEGDLWPRVARYARGRDYHNVIGKRLRKLARRVRESFPGCETRIYVDTGPVLERDLAQRAGLGAVGKNTLLLHPEAGSWFLLGELFTSLSLAPDPPIADLCGSCTRCLEACPTDALVEPYRLDARRCISYWTIEHRDPLPAEARPWMGDWVFGCDLCQEACPVNADPHPPARDPAFTLPPERGGLDLIALLRLSEQDYTHCFHGSPMQRAKRSGLRRNAAVAMGNRAQARYVEPLIEALSDPDPELRRHAAWALGQIATPEALAALTAALERESHPEVHTELTSALT